MVGIRTKPKQIVFGILLTILSCQSGASQQPEKAPSTTAQSDTSYQQGSATAGVFAPILDSEKRPITEASSSKARSSLWTRPQSLG